MNMVFSCEIKGRPFVKKNTKKFSFKSKSVYYSKQFLAWEKDALVYIKQAMQKWENCPIGYPCILELEFFFVNHQGEADVSNLIEGVQDALQKANVLVNDKFVYTVKASKEFGAQYDSTLIHLYRP